MEKASVLSGGKIVLRRISTVMIAFASWPDGSCPTRTFMIFCAAVDGLVSDLGLGRNLFTDGVDFLFGPIGGDGGVGEDAVAGPARRPDDHARPPPCNLLLARLRLLGLGSPLLELRRGRRGQAKNERRRAEKTMNFASLSLTTVQGGLSGYPFYLL